MVMPKSLSAYRECQDYFEQALSNPQGIAIEMDSPQLATRFAQKLNTYRVLLRRQSKEVFPIGHQSYDKSPYDGLAVVKDKTNPSRIEIKPNMMKPKSVTPL